MADLTTLANVKEYGSVSTAANDALLTRLVAAASSFVRRYTGRPFAVTSYTDMAIGDGRQVYVPQHYPVVSVTSVKVAGDTITEAADPAVDSGWYVVGNLVYVRGLYFTLGALVEVAYSAGEATPADIEQAAIELVLLKYRDAQHIGKASQSTAGFSVSYLPSMIPQSVKVVLDSYKRWVF